MVFGVFMAMLVTGFLYYIVGIGNTVIYRERMQDAADSFVFASAVMHARAMNTVALINIALGLLLAIWIALHIYQQALINAIILCGLAIGPCGPGLAALESAQSQVEQVELRFEETILNPARRLGHLAVQTMRTEWPVLARTRSQQQLRSGFYDPPVSTGIILPMEARALPLRAVQYERLRLHGHPLGLTLMPLMFPRFAATHPPTAPQIPPLTTRRFEPQATNNSLWHFEVNPGSGTCQDGLPGQNCEYVQLRGIVTAGRTPFAGNERGAAIANWGRNPGGGAFSALSQYAQIGVAQAEYYYDGTEERDEWAWHMYWSARFRRFRLDGIGLPVAGIDAAVLDRVVVH